jgi:hypothetical protein
LRSFAIVGALYAHKTLHVLADLKRDTE